MGSGHARRGVVAVLAAVLMAASAVVAMGAQAGAATLCQVRYTESVWSTGFIATVNITNLGDPWTSWELKYSYGGDERLVNGWNGGWSQNGRTITVRNDSWNGSLGTGRLVVTSAYFTYSGTHKAPTVFTVNGVTCGPPNQSTLTTLPNTPTQPPITPTRTLSPPATEPGPSITPKLHNPYTDGKVYVNPDWAAKAASEPGGTAVSNQPTFVWLEKRADITGTTGARGLREHLDTALAQGANVVQIVVNNLPGRDCSRNSLYSELSPSDLPVYKTEFINPIAEILADSKYRQLRIVAVLEVGALASLVTHTGSRWWGSTAACDTMLANGGYVDGIGYALAKLGSITNAYTYLDAGRHDSLGWDDDLAAALELAKKAATSQGSTLNHVHGFIVNAAAYSATTEPYFTVNDVLNGSPVIQSRWVDWNDFVDERPFARAWREKAMAAGFHSAAMLIDTSRNGWGGPHRPTGPGPRTSVDTYVDASRIDRRLYNHNWCNQSGAGLGERPQIIDADGIEAYVWAKPPGESDGTGNFASDYREMMCDPEGSPPLSSNRPTGALPGAPERGQWFSAQFRQLLQNAYPPPN
jgi:cellulose 1,4-beta-cellobiosidase